MWDSSKFVWHIKYIKGRDHFRIELKHERKIIKHVHITLIVAKCSFEFNWGLKVYRADFSGD